MENYTPKSHRSRSKDDPTEKKLEKVVSTTKTRKKNRLEKVAGNIFSEDIRNVKSYVVNDIVIPAALNLIEDVFNNGIHMLLRGESGRSNSRRSNADSVSYRNYYDDRSSRRYRDESRTRSFGFDYEDEVIPSRGEAERVIDSMEDIMDQYNGIVSVGDLNDLLGIAGRPSDHKYGWKNIRSAEVIRVRDGYMLKLPKAVVIN